jgi:hypothetical protein
MDMISQTVASNDFLVIIEEHRTHTHKRIANPSIGPYIPSAKVRVAYELLNTRPPQTSNNGALDDAKKQIKTTYNADAINYCDATQYDLENITKIYEDQAQLDPAKALDTFEKNLNASRTTAKNNANTVVDNMYTLAGKFNESIQAQLLDFMSTIGDSFAELTSKIGCFIGDLAKNLTTWGEDICNRITDFFTHLKNSI